MQRRPLLLLGAGAFAAPAFARKPLKAPAETTSNADAASGIRAALERGAEAAVELLGRKDGFLGNPKVRIEPPGYVKNASKLLRLAGQQKQIDELVTAMNRAAEAAVPEAKAMLVTAARSIGIADARRIVTGGDDSVTKFFAGKTRAPLVDKFLPVVRRETEKVDLAARFNAVSGKAAGMGLLKGKNASIERHVTEKALDGLYLMIGEEEKKIRKDPVGTGSALLARVFGR